MSVTATFWTVSSTAMSTPLRLGAGIGFGYGNEVTMENVYFDNAGGFALSMSGNNTVSMSNSRFTGSYAAAIEFQETDNTLSGSGNVHSATGGFCDGMTASSDQNGSFGFTDSTGTCP